MSELATFLSAVEARALTDEIKETTERLYIENDQIRFQYTTEVDARRRFARLAYINGWLVQEEVVVPGWGRIDIVLRSDATNIPVLVELKLELTKPSLVRRAFQQVDGYGRWWTRTKSEQSMPLLVGCVADAGVVGPVADTYPEVKVLDGGEFMTLLGNPGDHVSTTRLERAHARLEEARLAISVQEFAVAALSQSSIRDSEADA